MKKGRISKLRKPIRSSQIPATSAMLYEMEERLNHRMDSGFNRLQGEIHSLKSDMHVVKLLMEEQNAKNNYVLDGYGQIYDLIKKRNKLHGL